MRPKRRGIFDAWQGAGARRSSATLGSVAPPPPVAEMGGAEEACETSAASGSAVARRLSKPGLRATPPHTKRPAATTH